jgi:coenzyme F420-dependent glucose-6-phosphate dehydrogenase
MGGLRSGYSYPMPEFGYALSSEEHAPRELVRLACRAEETGFSFAAISDHFHPWVDRQGEAPFVWSVIGGIAMATERLRLGTGVTCPTIRIHPAIIAQAAATAAAMMPGRFFLGVGSGENLNEHILGDHWPSADTRLEMLEEAVEVIRKLWEGGLCSHEGDHYVVENARIYTLPDEPPPIVLAAAGTKAARLAGRIGDGFWSTSPESDLIKEFEAAGGHGPRYAQATVCWAPDEDQAKKTAHEWWPNAGLPGQLSQELPLPSHFEQAGSLVTADSLAEMMPMGPDPERHLEAIKQYVDAGFDHVYIHQIGPDQDGFFDFYQREILPRLT